MLSASEPGLDGEIGHAGELSDIRGDEGETKVARLGGDQKIIAANRRSGSLKMGADGGIGLVDRRVEAQDRKARQDRVQLPNRAFKVDRKSALRRATCTPPVVRPWRVVRTSVSTPDGLYRDDVE